MNAPKPRILCVDDEPRILESLALSLRRDFEVHTALNGDEALAVMGHVGNFAVICSDMRMPKMTGAVLLSRVMQRFPEVTRILLTGEPGRDAAVDAVNDGQIFRFLTKPCPSDRLKAAIDAAVDHHRLVTAERVLLQETLIGCIKALVDVLAITNPVAFGRASRVKRLAVSFATHLGYARFWQLEAAAMLSQLGYLSLPVELVEKLYYNQPLNEDEKTLASAVPEVANKLLGHIPRLEPVLQILAYLNPDERKAPNAASMGSMSLGAKILKLVLDYDTLVAQGENVAGAIENLKLGGRKHDSAMIDKLAAHLGGAGDVVVKHIPLRQVAPGMILMDELRSDGGILLVPRGFEVSEGFVTRMRNYDNKLLHSEVRVSVKQPPAK